MSINVENKRLYISTCLYAVSSKEGRVVKEECNDYFGSIVKSKKLLKKEDIQKNFTESQKEFYECGNKVFKPRDISEVRDGFETLPERLSPIFGKCLGKFIERFFTEFQKTHPTSRSCKILETGPGSGIMARDILNYLRDNCPRIYAKCEYHVLEFSDTLIDQQRSLFETSGHTDKIFYIRGTEDALDKIQDEFFHLHLANEFLDDLFSIKVTESDGIIFCDVENKWQKAPKEIIDYIKRYDIVIDRPSVLNIGIEMFLEKLYRVLHKEGESVMFDYYTDENMHFSNDFRYFHKENAVNITADVHHDCLVPVAENLGFDILTPEFPITTISNWFEKSAKVHNSDFLDDVCRDNFGAVHLKKTS